MVRIGVLVVLFLVLAACSPEEGAAPSGQSLNTATTLATAAGATGARGFVFPPAPGVPEGNLAPEVASSVETLVASADTGLDTEALDLVAASGDARLAWLIADFLRFLQIPPASDQLVAAFEILTNTDVDLDPDFAESPWRTVTDHLIAWDLPAPPGYRAMKAGLFVLVEPAWEPFFSDEDSDIDWRLVSWGGVLIDDRPLGENGFCSRGCIPALDDPALTDAIGGDWYSDGSAIFGVAVGGEAVAFPKHIMEIHELVNITIGGRRLGIPYCTLCASAQAYFLDGNPRWDQPVVLRTSGLLTRSNKVMYDFESQSVLDTFDGTALSGPMQDAGVVLEQTTVVASLWGDWKAAHPETRIVAEDGGIGRIYPDDPLGGRDAAGPIFPIGDVDPRLPVQALVVGVVGPEGPVAFPVEEARAAAEGGVEVSFAGVRLVADGSGFRAHLENGEEVAAHQAFWFAWSQFHPATQLWPG
jgi:hypothetical protein